MRAFLIDPEQRTITEIDFVGDYKQIPRTVDCKSFTTGAYLNGSIEDGFDTIYVSDDELDEADDPKHWFQVDADRNPPSSFPIAGKGLVLGVDTEGASAPASIGLDELTARITFTRRKFRGFETTEIPEGISVTVKAPIIEEK